MTFNGIYCTFSLRDEIQFQCYTIFMRKCKNEDTLISLISPNIIWEKLHVIDVKYEAKYHLEEITCNRCKI